MTTAQRWGWGLLTVLVTLSILFLLMPRADAGGYHCQGDQCDTTTTTTADTSTTTLITTTTTPETSSSSTTMTDNTSTTTLASTSTVPSESTTTTPTLLETVWTASASCHLLTADWGEGISQIDVWMRDPMFGDFGPADGLTRFTTPGETLEAATGTPTEFILIPIVEFGHVAVPDQISLFTEVCTPHPSTTPPTTIPTSPPELPLTGTTTKALVAIAAALSTLGFMVVKEAGRE